VRLILGLMVAAMTLVLGVAALWVQSLRLTVRLEASSSPYLLSCLHTPIGDSAADFAATF
jgi:hypothetical protein